MADPQILVSGVPLPPSSVWRFKGQYDPLCNFHENAPFTAPHPVSQEPVLWRSSERYFQARKVWGREAYAMAEAIRLAETNKEAKRLGRWKITKRPDWDDIAPAVMIETVDYKFDQNPHCVQCLLGTGGRYLMEGNYHHDNRWGVCFCERCPGDGDNCLGHCLMRKRARLQLVQGPGPDFEADRLLEQWGQIPRDHLELRFGAELPVLRHWLSDHLTHLGV